MKSRTEHPADGNGSSAALHAMYVIVVYLTLFAGALCFS